MHSFAKKPRYLEDPTYSDSEVVSSWLKNPCRLRSKSDFASVDDIQTLTLQLHQLKERLGPSSREAASALGITAFQAFCKARRATNPFEKLGEGQGKGLNTLFMNRSAIKLANIDALCDYVLTSSTSGEPWRFVDLCGAPGGFSEYIMRRCLANGDTCEGFGMSLNGSNENGTGLTWKLEDMVHEEGDSKVTFRVCNGEDGTGDIFQWKNVGRLVAVLAGKKLPIRESSKVRLVTADGGFDAQRDKSDQEGITQKLVVCQVAAALSVLQYGGYFVVKMFGFQSDVVRNVMIHLAMVFEDMIVLKPISSRPASAERYVVCTGFRGCGSDWDGQRWCNKMFLGSSETADDGELTRRFIDMADRDMLILNTKTCGRILSYLEACRLHGGYPSFQQPSADYCTVDVDSYKLAWNLI